MLASQQAQWFYTHGIKPFPSSIDVGHPPLLPAYLAIVWHMFGQSLEVSHWAMLPFLWLIVWAIHHLAELISSRFWDDSPLLVLALSALLLLQPTLLAQATLISPDIPLCAFFLCALWHFLQPKSKQWRGLYAVWLVLLSFTSLRGMIAVALFAGAECVCLFLENTPSLKNWKSLAQVLVRSASVYLPALFLFSLWYRWHSATTGNIGWHDTSSSEFYRAVWDISGLVKNEAVFVWRLVDFGAGAVWIVLGASLYQLWKQSRAFGQSFSITLFDALPQRLCVLAALSLAAWMLIVAVLPIYSISHRYFLPLQLLVSISAVLGLFGQMKFGQMKFGQKKFRQTEVSALPKPNTVRSANTLVCASKRSIYAVLCVVLLTGHCWAWLYPPTLAKGWDATLAYLPYDGLRKQVLRSIQVRGIAAKDIHSRNFAIFSARDLDLVSNADTLGYGASTFGSTRYVFFASVLNGFKDEEIRALQKWKCLERAEAWGMVVELRERP